MPRNTSEGDLPHIAIATGSSDAMECVLRKMGIADTEFTNPGGSGSISLYKENGPTIDHTTPAASTLYNNETTMAQYDEILLPCPGAPTPRPAAETANLVNYANAGGRILTSHDGYTWLYQTLPFGGTAAWDPGHNQSIASATVQVQLPPYGPPQILTDWLNLLGALANPTPPELTVKVIRHDVDSVSTDAVPWLAGSDPADGTPMVSMFSFDTPVAASNAVGRVIFDDFHVEDIVSSGATFPNECGPAAALSAQEKLFEYSMYNLDACISP